MGIDIGTTSTKILVSDTNGNIIEQAEKSYSLIFPEVGFAEQNPLDLIDAVHDTMKEVTSRLKEKAKFIKAISLSTQRDTMVITDKDNKAIYNAITWMDSRSKKECEEMKTNLSEKAVYESTGVPVSTIWTGAFIMWIKDHMPQLFKDAYCFGLVHDYVMCYLGAESHYLDTTNACQTMMYDFINDCWDTKILNYLNIDSDRLPRLVTSGSVIGTLSKKLSAEFNMSDDVKLVAGGGDQQCAMLGTGSINNGDGEISIGTAANIMAVVDKPILDPDMKLICHRSLVKNGYMVEGAMLSTGKLVEWLLDTFYQGIERKEALNLLNKDVSISKPGANGLIITPHFEGSASPHWNEEARGICLGLTLSTSRGDIARAVYEGIAIEIRKNLDLMEKLGTKVTKAVVSGGAVNSDIWMQIIADVLKIDITVLENRQCAAMGAVIIAGIGANIFKDEKEAAEKMVKIRKIYKPDPSLSALYDRLLETNLNSYSALDRNSIYKEIIELKKTN